VTAKAIKSEHAGRADNPRPGVRPAPLYSLPPLAYRYDAFEPLLAGEIIDLHYNAHHAAYVKGANKAVEDLAEARSTRRFDMIGQLERNLVFNFSGHVLHSLLWRNLSPNGGGEPDGDLAAAIDQDFGSFAAFKAQLNAVCQTLQGAGWGALCWDPLGRQLIVEQIDDHHNNIGRGSMPILAIDMWEHAYYLQFHEHKDKWLEAYWDLVDWQDVARRFATVRQAEIDV
jgi:Fe-Mn family superoxide dismutase